MDALSFYALNSFTDSRAHGLAAHKSGTVLPDIAAAKTALQGFVHRVFDRIRFGSHVEGEAQHHSGGKNRADGVGFVQTISFSRPVKASPFQERPFRDATRKATTLQKEGACASEAQGMRETRNKPLVGL